MKFTRWVKRPGLKVHLKTMAEYRYLCGMRAQSGDQQTLLRINTCGGCKRVHELIKKRGYRW